MAEIATESTDVMSFFDSDGVQLHYKDIGSGSPILLIHGFGSNIHINWQYSGWVDVLTNNNRRVIAIDNRGHGESEKIHDPNRYGAPIMAEDAKRLLDHLEIPQADLMGYSMGARISAFLCMNYPDRINRAVWGGLGYNMIKGFGNSAAIAQALEAESMADIKEDFGKAHRKFAERTGSDRFSLAACIRSSRKKILESEIATVDIPVLVAVGTDDEIAGSANDLADLLPRGTVLDIPGRDHMLAVGDKVFKEGVLEFLEGES